MKEVEEQALSKDDQGVLEFWELQCERVGIHYQLPIPFKNEPPELSNNRVMAFRRLMSLRRPFSRDKEVPRRYTVR